MNSLNPRVIKTNIRDFKPLEKGDRLCFGQARPIWQQVAEWKRDPRTKRAYASQKRRSLAAALKEIKDLYDVSEFFADLGQNDDTFPVFYRKKAS